MCVSGFRSFTIKRPRLCSKGTKSTALINPTLSHISRHKDVSHFGQERFSLCFTCGVFCVCLQVLELLLAMCAVSGLRSLLCEVVFRPAGPKLRVAGRGAGPDAGCKGEAGLALMQWLSSPVDGAESCSLQALQLLTELLEVRNRNLFRSGVSVTTGLRLTVRILYSVWKTSNFCF